MFENLKAQCAEISRALDEGDPHLIASRAARWLATAIQSATIVYFAGHGNYDGFKSIRLAEFRDSPAGKAKTRLIVALSRAERRQITVARISARRTLSPHFVPLHGHSYSTLGLLPNWEASVSQPISEDIGSHQPWLYSLHHTGNGVFVMNEKQALDLYCDTENPVAFDLLRRAFDGDLKRYISNNKLSRYFEPDELLQEVWAKVAAERSFGKQVRNPIAWVTTIAHRLMVNSARKQLTSKTLLHAYEYLSNQRPDLQSPDYMILLEKNLASKIRKPRSATHEQSLEVAKWTALGNSAADIAGYLGCKTRRVKSWQASMKSAIAECLSPDAYRAISKVSRVARSG